MFTVCGERGQRHRKSKYFQELADTLATNLYELQFRRDIVSECPQ